ncbi:Ubiquitin fusion degradation protein 4 [Paecilomyces lecythidis]
MSSRITRSAARLAAEPPVSTSTGPSASIPAAGPAPSRKRKAPVRRDRSLDEPDRPRPSSPPRRAKRQRTAASAQIAAPADPRRGPHNGSAMSQQRCVSSRSPPDQDPDHRADQRLLSSSSSRPSDESSRVPASSSASRRKSSNNRKTTQGKDERALVRGPSVGSTDRDPSTDARTATQSPPARRQKKRPSKQSSDLIMKESEEDYAERERREERDSSPPSESNDGTNHSAFDDDEEDDDDDDDPFRSSLFGSRSPMGLQSTLRALSGMMSGTSSRLRDILSNLRMRDDPSLQLIALQELSDLLLVSNEDNLSGQFSPDPYVKELVALMQPSDFGEENPEIMLLACRCLANLMEALRGSVANVVYGGAVPVLCQKLLDIQFIDLAEQALSTLAKISVDFPASIVREGGLTACLTYLDFFPTSTQRTAVTTAANCCRNLPHDAFPVVRDVMPTLLNVLSSNDQKVVEQGCLCVSRIVESFKNKPDKLEDLIEPAMLKAVLRLLLPGTTNLIGPHIHTQFLRVLAIVSKASPRLSVELLKMDVVDTLYQILTGVSAPPNVEGAPIKIDNVLIMQALIHRPREQVFETLNVICELLPDNSRRGHSHADDDLLRVGADSDIVFKSAKARETAEKRRQLLLECRPELKRFAMILMPTLTDAYSSTVNLGVRQKVLTAQLKMLQNLDAAVIEEALRTVPYASFLAAILSQKDHPSLVSLALQCAEILFQRLENIYQYQFHREGVISEVIKLAEKPLSTDRHSKSPRATTSENTRSGKRSASPSGSEDTADPGDGTLDNDDHDDEEGQDGEEDEDDQDDDQDDENDDMSDSETSSFSGRPLSQTMDAVINDQVVRHARAFLRLYEGSEGKAMHDRATKILDELQELAADIEASYLHGTSGDGSALFQKLASYFDGDALESITSSELLNSGIIKVLLDVVGNPQGMAITFPLGSLPWYTDNSWQFSVPSMRTARTAFLQAFMGKTISEKAKSQTSATTPFSILIQKLHDLLSRTEHFEVITVSHNSLENTRSNAAYMLGKQLRLKLVADDDSDIPRPYKNIMVSIHAIATFKSLDDFLRPRISLSDRPRVTRTRETILSQLASAARLRDFPGGGSDLLGADSSIQQPPSRISSGTNDGEPTSSAKPPLAQRSSTDNSRGRRGTGRRSSRQESSSPEDARANDPLECADEKQMSEDEEDDGADEDELNAIVDDLDDDMSDDNAPDPSAVNMEVASTGRITARKEDGTRVATPSQSTPTSKPSSSAPTSGLQSMGGSSLALAGRPFSSYAAAMASIPQDWHIEFTMDGKPISNETTIYRAVHQQREALEESYGRNVWSAVHTVKFRRVPGPPPPEPSTLAATDSDSPAHEDDSKLPPSLNKDPTTASILQLLGVLHEINVHLDDILAESKELIAITPEPLNQFINTKLTAKLNRQLEEPLIVASSCLPSWSEDLARQFPFLFPFETRHLFLQSTAFGYSRSMMRWQNSQSGDDSRRDQGHDDRPFLGRLQRQKVRISRSRILESAMKVMELYGSSASVLEVEYFEEVGTGLGPTLEFYSTVSKEFSKKKLKIWRENESNDRDEYAFGKLGLFPAPMSDEQANSEAGKKQLQLFKTLGKFVARSMLDSRIIDISFNPTFFRIGDCASTVTPSLGTVKAVDQDLANSLLLVKRFANAKKAIDEDKTLSPSQKPQYLRQIEVDGVKVEDLALDFTLPGYPAIELIKNGANIPVMIDNVDLYLDRVIDMTLGGGVRRQVDAFRSGFSQVFPYSSLRAFTPNELVMLFGRIEEDWSIETLMDSIKADHGFNMDSRSVRNLLQTMSELSPQERRDFLQFVTGSPKLPIGGFKSLTPMFTVVCRPSEPPYTSDDYLPSVMTCVNYLKLPDYSSLDILRQRLSVAIKEGQGAFHLS